MGDRAVSELPVPGMPRLLQRLQERIPKHSEIAKGKKEMLTYEKHETREEWLSCRDGHLGASEAGAILGVGFISKVDLWKIKTGRAIPKDLSGNPAVAYGNRAEDPLRQLFMAKHPELKLDYHPYDYIFQTERPWLRATLDGELTDRSGSKGILEIKTSFCMSRADWAKWNNRVPDGYLAQVTHQFLATEFSYTYLFAELVGSDGNSSLREYLFLRDDMREDMEYLLEEEEKFWKCVTEDRIPAVPLRL